MTLRPGPNANTGEAALRRFAVIAAAVSAWLVLAIAGFSWVQLAEQVLELPGLRVALLDSATELVSPDGLMRRAIRRTTGG